MISYRYLSILVIFFVLSATKVFALGPYRDNGDTILDQATGLEWEKGYYTGEKSNLLSWKGALNYCETLDLAGRKDWRLPNKIELRSIVDHSKKEPPVIAGPFYGTSTPYWTSTTYIPTFIVHREAAEDNIGRGWLIDFESGLDFHNFKNHSEFAGAYTRCVRTPFIVEPHAILNLVQVSMSVYVEKLADTGQVKCYNNVTEIKCSGPNFPDDFNGQDAHYDGMVASFRDNRAEKTIRDMNNNLLWQKETARAANWQDAIDYCAGIELDGNNGWRLPTKNELQSIVDYGVEDPKDDNATSHPAFSSVASGYWSATPLVHDSRLAWAVFFDNGNDYMGNKASLYYVRCVNDNKNGARKPANRN